MEKKKILLVDDEEHFTQLVKMNLEATGKYEVKIENRGALGFTAAKEFKPDVIILDILMPDMEGSEVASQLAEDKDTQGIPVIFLTAIIKENEVKESGGFISGHRFVAKPISADKLIEVIERAMAGGSSQ